MGDQGPEVTMATSTKVGVVVAAAGATPAPEKIKFTVSVRGHQWSSARHVHETLQEFAKIIQRNARRLEFIDESDNIQRLQLANADGSDPEDLDVDGTLEDVIICMGSKQLIAVVNSATKTPPDSNGRGPETEKLGPASPMALATLHKPKIKPDHTAPNGFGAPFPTSGSLADAGAPNVDRLSPTIGPKYTVPPTFCKPNCRAPLHSKPINEPATRGLKIAIPPSDPASVPFLHEDRPCAFHQDSDHRPPCSQLPPMVPSRSNSLNGKVGMCSAKGVQGGPARQFTQPATPSPAELAQYLVRSSSHPHRMQPAGGGGMGAGTPTKTPCNRSTPNGGFQSFASALLSRLPMMPTNDMHCPHGTPTTNIAMLATFLASHLRTFLPVEGNGHPSDTAHATPTKEFNKVAGPVNDKILNSSKPPPNGSNNGQAPEKETHEKKAGGLHEKGSANAGPENIKLSGSGSQEKDESSSSADVNIGTAPSSNGVESGRPKGHSELVFLVNRRSKTGAGTHHLKMGDLSKYFHLSVVDAAKKLGVSQTTLKKACRKFGLKRWPGRKVRSLESTIHGLEHTIAVGQGAGLEELTEAYMRSEVSKLQQEMDQLVHGTPAQHSPLVRTADLYKRLYSRGWRSKYHSPGRHDIDLKATSTEAEICGGLRDPTKVIKCTGCKPPAAAMNQQLVQQQTVINIKDDSPNETVTVAITKDTAIKEKLNSESLPGDSVNEIDQMVCVPIDNGAVINFCNNHNNERPMCVIETVRAEVSTQDDKSELNYSSERSPKRAKRDCRNISEGGAGREGLRSSTCGM